MAGISGHSPGPPPQSAPPGTAAVHSVDLLKTRLESRALLATLALLAGAACQRSVPTPRGDHGPLVTALRQEPAQTARWGVRFSVPTVAEGCWQNEADTIVNVSCRGGARDLSSGVASIAGRAATAIRDGIDVDAIHAAALIDLLASDTVGTALDRSISYLEMATQLAPRSAAAFSDLAGAHLVAAERRSDAFHLFAALDVASRAVEIDPTNQAARFNRAMSLDLLALDGEADKEWRRYLQRDSTSTWASRARVHLTRHRGRGSARRPVATAPPDSLEAFAKRHPFEARAFAWEQLLGGWGEAVMVGDSARAEAGLGAASVVAKALASSYEDSSIALATRSIAAAATNGPVRRRLGELHASFARALGRTRKNDHLGADSAYVAILSDPGASPVLRQWARYGHANAMVYARRYADATASAQALLDEIDPRHQPSLAGRTHWLMGMVHLRLGDNDRGLQSVREAASLLAHAGDEEHLFGALGVEGETAFRIGDEATGYQKLWKALRGLRAYPTSTWRHNVLLLLGGRATIAGLDHAAFAIEDEDFAVADASDRPVSVLETRLARARVVWSLGNSTLAQAAIDTAARAVASLPFTEVRKEFETQLRLTLATGPLSQDRPRAYAMLDSVVAFYSPAAGSRDQPNAAKLLPALVARARAALELGRVDEAERDLARAVSMHAAQRRSLASLPQRAALAASARSIFESLATIRLAQGRSQEALDAIEESRLAFSPVPLARTVARRPRAPRDDITLNYALIGDTLFTWILGAPGLDVIRSQVARSDLNAVIDRMRTGFELGASEHALNAMLAQLYRWLVKPSEKGLQAPGERLTIIADGILAAVPFAALFDEERKGYLVDRYAIRVAASLQDTEQSPKVHDRPRRALFAANPTFDAAAFAGLPELPHSEREVAMAAASYQDTTRLTGAFADSASIVSRLPKVDVFHFAGHALFDDVRPDRSRLVLATRGLDVNAIASLPLGGLRLVVLSACESVRAGERRGSGFAGLAEAFLAAGADGVVGSLWRVDDAHTAELMRAFHVAYSRTGDAAASLREAQTSLRHSTTPAVRSPAAWGAFRYVGQ